MQPLSEKLRTMAEHVPSVPGQQLSKTVLTRAATRTEALERRVAPWLDALRRRVDTRAQNKAEQAPPPRSSQGQAAGQAIPLPPRPGETERWDEVDEASWESFPASDAPAHWAGKDKY